MCRTFDCMMVTGGAGFIGSNFIRYLFGEGGFEGKVVNVDCLTYAGNPLSLVDVAERVGDRYAFVRGDICDRELIERVVDEHGVDAICHFAAESHVDRSIVAPDAFIQSNIVGTYTLLEVARSRSARIGLFHHVSTDEVFGSLGATGLFTEQTPYSPNSPYSASKASSDHLVRAYHETYDLPVTISNCSNNYGPYHFPEKLIPLMILNALEGKPLPVYGDGKNVRDWLHVEDHCRAVWTIMNGGRPGETYNVGGCSEMANIDVVRMICDLTDEMAEALPGRSSRRDLITFVKDRPGHDRRYAIDCSKLKAELAWRQQETFATGLRKSIEWYMSNPEWVESVRTGEYRDWIAAHYG